MKRLYLLVLLVAGALILAWGCTQQPTGGGSRIMQGAGGSGTMGCPAGQVQCGASCVDLATNSANCGACATVCAAGTVCTASMCSCQPGLSNCAGACVNLAMDARNCGTCGIACGVTQGCTASACSCPVGSLACGPNCVDSTSDVNNCGGCNIMCQTGQSCQGGTCACLSGGTNCGAGCVDTMSDPANCGGCGIVCPAGTPFCSLGVCSASCSQGETPCTTPSGTACIADITTSEAHCGACNNACAPGQECNGSACGCPDGTTSCGGQCVNTMTDVNNCGGCAMACMGGQACNAGACTCTTPGQSFCNGQCRDTMSDSQNCGASCTACGAGQTCQSGVCGCPPGQVPCDGACVPDGQCGGSGGAGGGGGSGGSGGSPPTPVDLNCGMWNGVNVSVPAADVISDFNQPTPIMYQTGTRGGTIWYAYGAEDSGDQSSTPGVGSNAFEVDATNVGPCNSGGSLKVSSPGNDNSDIANGWGVGFGINLMGDVPGVMPPKKDIYNAQAAGYTGIGFFMKCQAEADFVYFKVVDGPNDADIQNPTCSYSSGTICNQFGIKNATAVTSWTYQRVYFAEALQDWEPTTISTGSVAADKLTAFQVQVNTKYTRDGSTRVKNPFTCWVDDVHFLKDPPPRNNANVTPKTCMGGTPTSAPGGYYTMGNRIYDCKTGQPKIFKGMARPSLEWDRAGWNITYEDLARIKSWNANIVRFSLNQPFWLDSSNKGQLYRRTIDRAVKWSLALGMDVILDLHWTGTINDYGQKNMPNRDGITFWQQVANAYKNEGRVIFELYNEPFGVDATVWKNGQPGQWAGMQEMYNAVRGAGANNLVLVGGLDYAYRLDQVLPAQALSPAVNVAYVTHPYQFKAGDSGAWTSAFGTLAQTYPVFATEFGQANINQPGGTQSCDSNFYSSIIDYFNASPRFMSWTAWAWHVERQITNANDTCGFPQVITQYGGTTNPAGTVVKQKMMQ